MSRFEAFILGWTVAWVAVVTMILCISTLQVEQRERDHDARIAELIEKMRENLHRMGGSK